MEKGQQPPAYGFEGLNKEQPPPYFPNQNIQQENVQQLPYNPGMNVMVPQVPTQQVIVTTMVPLGPDTTRVSCPHCHASIMTTVQKEPGTKAWLSGFIIALLGCWCGCCLIPCCTDSCLDTKHTCPNCSAFIGEHKS